MNEEDLNDLSRDELVEHVLELQQQLTAALAAVPKAEEFTLDDVTVWTLPKSTLVRVGIAHVRSSIYVAQPTSDSQFSAVLLLTPLQMS